MNRPPDPTPDQRLARNLEKIACRRLRKPRSGWVTLSRVKVLAASGDDGVPEKLLVSAIGLEPYRP